MYVADEIKKLLPIRRVVEYYGFPPGRNGFIPCPFHQGDHTPSLKIYEGTNTWKCFGCGNGGSSIDFVMDLNACSFEAACRELDALFSLGLYRKHSFKEHRKRKAEAENRREAARRLEAQKEYSGHQYNTLLQYRRWLAGQKETKDVRFDLDYMDRLLDKFLGYDELITFDAAARVNALLSKHPNRGDYDLHGGEY